MENNIHDDYYNQLLTSIQTEYSQCGVNSDTREDRQPFVWRRPLSGFPTLLTRSLQGSYLFLLEHSRISHLQFSIIVPVRQLIEKHFILGKMDELNYWQNERDDGELIELQSILVDTNDIPLIDIGAYVFEGKGVKDLEI